MAPKLIASLLLAGGLAALAAPAGAAGKDCGPRDELKAINDTENNPQHQKQLHDALNLTPQQEGAWQKYVGTLRQTPPGQSGKRADWSTLSAPERIELLVNDAKRNEDHMTQVVNEMKTFYSALNTDQKKTFDRFHGGMQTDKY